ncbi:MAG: NAD(P)H-dependent oxidoreductase [Chitinophagaceae bacterium]
MANNAILLLLFHPRFENSYANKKLLAAAQAVGGITIRDMYEIYPDYNIDVKVEQAILLQHQIIIWQHPFYWYSCPPLMKQWIDLVFEHGWAYGKTGDKLKGKYLMSAISSGGTFEIYQKQGRNRYTYKELLAPFDQTAYLCQLTYLPPFIVPGANKLTEEQVVDYATKYQEVLRFLQQADWDVAKICSVPYFNDLKESQWQETYCKMR